MTPKGTIQHNNTTLNSGHGRGRSEKRLRTQLGQENTTQYNNNTIQYRLAKYQPPEPPKLIPRTYPNTHLNTGKMASQSQLGTWKVFLFAAYSATQQLSFSALVPRERSKYPTQKRPGSLRDIISHNLDSKLSPNCPKFTEIHDKKIQQNSLSCCHQLLPTTHALRSASPAI